MDNNITLHRENIAQKLLAELTVIKKCFPENKETFNSKDNFNKFILFSMYRGIEDCINTLMEERIINSPSKRYCEIIKEKLQSNFIEDNFLKLMITEITDHYDINYNDIMTYINTEETSVFNFIINNINDITNNRYKATDIVEYDFFSDKYKYCKANRNKILHSVIANNSDVSRNAVIYSFIVYSYLMLVLNKIS